jgi:hypothetical protein
MKFIIDSYTKSKNKLIRRLLRLKTTISCEDGGEYNIDRSLSQVLIETSLTESELDFWLWNTEGIEYIGVCENNP